MADGARAATRRDSWACCSFVPPHILDALAARDAEESAEPGPSQRTAIVTRQLAAERQRNRLNNAFWDGVRLTMGNGDGVIFVDFAASPDVVGHELGHGVVQFTANLDYQGQSGALNESYADVFGSLIEQRLKGEDFDTANWLIGDEIMAPGLYGEALRSMAHPGTAYNNSILGQDPQPDHMDNYYAGPADNQGVHINSGIPNRAFYLTAEELGTDAAGAIWYAGLQNLWPTAVFTDAAAVLAAQARILARDGSVPRQAAQVVRSAWRRVGVV